jgi:hypothetical protein
MTTVDLVALRGEMGRTTATVGSVVAPGEAVSPPPLSFRVGVLGDRAGGFGLRTISPRRATLESWPFRRQLVVHDRRSVLVVRPKLDLLSCRTVFALARHHWRTRRQSWPSRGEGPGAGIHERRVRSRGAPDSHHSVASTSALGGEDAPTRAAARTFVAIRPATIQAAPSTTATRAPTQSTGATLIGRSGLGGLACQVWTQVWTDVWTRNPHLARLRPSGCGGFDAPLCPTTRAPREKQRRGYG